MRIDQCVLVRFTLGFSGVGIRDVSWTRLHCNGLGSGVQRVLIITVVRPLARNVLFTDTQYYAFHCRPKIPVDPELTG